MKRCNSCGQILSQKITTCPACGSQMVAGLSHIDDYQIKAIIHEGRSSMVCRAIKSGHDKPVSIRLFTEQSGVDDAVAARLENELSELKKLPPEHFVQHYRINKSRDGLYYRVSEWVNAQDWGSIFISGILKDQRKVVTLFRNIASVLDLLHKKDHFMPYLILDDILIPKDHTDDLHVKINYKLSRFLNARATHHGPMLQKLLDCHPDIINHRAIDFKSAIWSLGKTFVEILTANPNVTDFSNQVDQIEGLDPELAVLIKVMLSNDPDLRPQSMSRVVDTLSRILDRLPYAERRLKGFKKKPKLLKELNWFKKVVVILIFVIAGLIATGTFSWYYMQKNKVKDETLALSGFVESYAGSVAFLMVEYWLTDDSEVIYKNKVEGTAFLVDPQGYLLTNRHVACPWLEDTTLFQAYAQYTMLNKALFFNYRMFLWFEGEKAFTRLPALKDSVDLSDSYYLSSAFSSEGKGKLRIVGVPRSTVSTGEMIRSPFKNDYAVLKIDNPPAHLKPLPLETGLKTTDIKRLSPVVILGFPLGNRTQADHINTSITRGHVRRTTKEIIQVDSSIYKGNSGGPAINADGRVIGIASGVITDQTSGYFKVSTPLSDFGLILPISRPARLVDAIKTGLPHWDGLLDFSLEAKLDQITQLAVENRFEDAQAITQSMLKTSKDPVLLYAAGMLYFCTGNMENSKYFFKKLAYIEPENATAKLMLYTIDWLNDSHKTTPLTRPLFEMKWYDDEEYLGYLATVLRDQKRMRPDFYDYENRSEKSWRFFIEGMILEQEKDLGAASVAFKQSILHAAINDWVYFLSFSRLNHINQSLAAYLEEKQSHETQVAAFKEKALAHRKAVAELKTTITELVHQFESDQTKYDQKIDLYKKMMALAPENRTISGRIAFFHATHGEWEKALHFIDAYFEKPCRETSLSLSLGLLKGQIFSLLGRHDEALEYLDSFSNQIQAPWYTLICKHIIQEKPADHLIKIAGNKPENLITMHTALGLMAESKNDLQTATHHYREALSTYLDNWNEYDLALGRIMSFRSASK